MGVPVGVAIPVRNHSPRLQVGVFGLQIATAVAFVVTSSVWALVAVGVAALGVGAIYVSEQHRVLATTSGGTAIMATTFRHVPIAQIGIVEGPFNWPEPKGLGAAVELEGRTWWIDSWDFPRLSQARGGRRSSVPGDDVGEVG